MRLVTYNVLAQAYLRPSYYPHSRPEDLEAGPRRKCLLERIAGLQADVLCLQEVELDLFEALRAAGRQGRYLPKGRNKPDGCATFVTGDARWSELEYADGSGHVALLLQLGDLQVANTHLKFKQGLPQIQELVTHLRGHSIVCGDFNVEEGDDVLRHLREHEFEDGAGPAITSVTNAGSKKIDFIFHTAGLRLIPDPPRPLPIYLPDLKGGEPSDHLPVGVSVERA